MFCCVTLQREAKKKHQKEAEQRIERESGDGEEQEVMEAPGEEPKPPAKVDMSTVRSEVTDRLFQSLRPPGEPKVHLELTTSGPVDQSPACSK
jgi:hypothetical protein